MGFVERNSDGIIVGWFVCEQLAPMVTEQIADDDPAGIGFLNPPAPVPSSCTELGLKRAFDELGTWAAAQGSDRGECERPGRVGSRDRNPPRRSSGPAHDRGRRPLRRTSGPAAISSGKRPV